MRRLVIGLAIGIASFAPSWAAADDEQIAKAIVEKLEARKKQGQLKGFNIDLKVEEGKVWMSGHVASPEQQTMALDLARRVEGVQAVVNDLKVKSPAARPTATSTAAATKSSKPAKSSEKTAAAPAKSDEARPALLSKLFGGSEGEASKSTPARDPAVSPVAHEDSAAETNANEALIEAMADRLNQHKESGALKDFDINLSADQGVVTVAGDVSNRSQRDLVLDTLRRTRGVKKVVNLLHVSEEPAAEPTPAARPAARLAPREESAVVPAGNSKVEAPVGTGMPAAPAPVARATQVTGMNGGAYAAIPVQMVPAGGQPAHVGQRPLAFAPASGAMMQGQLQPVGSMPAHMPGPGFGVAPARFDHPQLPGYAWPSYAAHPNYAAVTYPKQYSPSAWPYIGPFYPYPQVPLGWRKVMLEWDDGWWYLDFKDK